MATSVAAVAAAVAGNAGAAGAVAISHVSHTLLMAGMWQLPVACSTAGQHAAAALAQPAAHLAAVICADEEVAVVAVGHVTHRVVVHLGEGGAAAAFLSMVVAGMLALGSGLLQARRRAGRQAVQTVQASAASPLHTHIAHARIAPVPHAQHQQQQHVSTGARPAGRCCAASQSTATAQHHT